jgi:hypothetical protein
MSDQASISGLAGSVYALSPNAVSLAAGSSVIGKVDQDGAWTVAATQSGTWSVAQSGTWTVNIAASQTIGLAAGSNVIGAVTQSGTWSVGVSGTVAVTQSGTWTVGIAPPVGYANFAPGQVASVTSSATSICAARTGAAGTGRGNITVFNTGANTIYLGGSGVTTSTGLPLYPGGSVTLPTTAAIYGICASTLTSSAAFYEVY